MGYPVEIDLEFIKLAQDVHISCNFGIGSVNDVAGSVVLNLCEHLGLFTEMADVLLDAGHQSIKISPQS